MKLLGRGALSAAEAIRGCSLQRIGRKLRRKEGYQSRERNEKTTTHLSIRMKTVQGVDGMNTNWRRISNPIRRRV